MAEVLQTTSKDLPGAAAKQFFVDRVLSQAAAEGIALSEAERHSVSWSESDPNFEPDFELAERLESEMPREEFETKIAGLLRRAYEADVSRDTSSKDRYREAYRNLKKGDHYILVMIESAIGRHIRRWGLF